MQKRVAVLIDGGSFFHLQCNVLKWWVDLERLLDWLDQYGRLAYAVYFNQVAASDGQERYHHMLSNIGFSVVTRSPKIDNNGAIFAKANIAIDIVLFTMTQIENFDTLVLISGNSDFDKLITTCQARGKEVLVLAADQNLSREIKDIVGLNFIDLNNIADEVKDFNKVVRINEKVS
jgi:uncharacterized protein (TIGR00288 family)